MEFLNTGFYNVTDKIVELQAFFITFAHNIAYVVLLISIFMAALNHGLTGQGMKDSIIKISKALIFYYLVIFAYPNIVSYMTSMTFSLARDSTYSSMSSYLSSAQRDMEEHARRTMLDGKSGTYGDMALNDYDNIFRGIINNRTFTAANGRTFSYSTVAPAAAVSSILLIAGECFTFADKQNGFLPFPDFGAILKGVLCALAIMFTGFFAILEYLMAFMEFMFISSVGIILFPLTLWDGTKFMAEKYITAMIGFFIKLLFCTICIFLMLYGYLSLAKSFVIKPFAGEVEQIVALLFSGLLYFYICKLAPAIAQGLLTGAPSLSASGVIGTVVAAGAAAAGVAGMAGGAAAGVTGATGAVAKAAGTYNAATQGVDAGSGAFHRASVGMRAVGSEIAHAGADLTKSLVGLPKNEDGTNKTFAQYYGEKYRSGEKIGGRAAKEDNKRNDGKPLY